MRLAQEGMHEQCEPQVRLAANSLDIALDEYAAIMAERFLPNAPQERGDILKAFATDHSVPK